MQGTSVKSHGYPFSSSLKGQQIPEDEIFEYHYHSSDSSTTSLDENEPSGFHYPTDNLGTSWGSYLYSGPPTRAGLAGTHKKLVVDEAGHLEEDKNMQDMRKTKPMVVLLDPVKVNGTQPTATSIPRKSDSEVPPITTVSHNSEHKSTIQSIEKLTPQCTLLREIHILMGTVQHCEQEMSKNGTGTEQLKSLISTTHRAYTDLQQLARESVTNGEIEVLSMGVLLDIIRYLREVLQSFAQQSKKLHQDAESLQKTGRQLSRNQDQYFREQREIQQAIEEARTHLIQEKRLFEQEMTERKDEMKRLQHELSQQVTSKQQKSQLGTVHEVMQARNQLAALLQTQKEQSKLEKLLLGQQRELQRIQRDLDNIKAELLSTQDHALKLEHKMIMYKRKALPAQHRDHITEVSKREKARKGHTLRDSGWQGILTAQKALDREVLRIKRQLEEQQLRERLVTKQLEDSNQSLKKRALSLRQQAAGIKGKSPYVPSDNTDYADDVCGGKQVQRRGKTNAPHLPQIKGLPPKPVVRKKERKKPTYAFSRQELVTLACFSDDEASDSVMEWLRVQGNLLD